MSTAPPSLPPLGAEPRLTPADLERAAAEAVAARPSLPAPAPARRGGRVLVGVAVIAAAVSVILAQVGQLRAQHERHQVIDDLQAQVDSLSTELGCRSVYSARLDLSVGDATESILRGLAALAADDPERLRAIAENAGRIADRVAAASLARQRAADTCAARAANPGASP